METCHCCGFKTIGDSGNWEICPICFWEDDPVQSADPWFVGGANKAALFHAQKNNRMFGAIEERFVKDIRTPTSDDVRDQSWRTLLDEDKNYCTTPAEIERECGDDKKISHRYWERFTAGVVRNL